MLYYWDDYVSIYHADCRDILPMLLDQPEPWAFVTDPPYGINATTRNASSGRGRNARAHDWPAIAGDDEPFDPTWLLARRVPSVLWGANHYATRLPVSPSWLVWDKRVSDVSNDSADCEMAWTNLGGPARMFRHRWMGMLRDSEKGEAYHPTQKPLALMRWCLSLLPPDVVVVDPFMGSGTTLVAAKSLGRRAIGIEIEEQYCRIAETRCRQETLGLSA